MHGGPPNEITEQLIAWSKGDEAALETLIPAVYQELRRMADYYLRGEDSGHSLQPTALVHEAYLRLIDQTKVEWQNRAHFFGVAAQMFREGEKLYLLDRLTGKWREILSLKSPSQIGSYALSRDNKRLYYTSGSSEADIWLLKIQGLGK